MSSSSRVYVGKLGTRTTDRELEEAFNKFGKISKIDMKNGFAFIDFEDTRDAEDAVRDMDNRTIDGERVIVEHAKGERGGRRDRDSRGGGRRDYRDRDYGGRDGGRDSRDSRDRRTETGGRCFNCGKDGHWARDCPDEDGRDRCFNCGRPGHLARECKEKRGAGRDGRDGKDRSHPYSRSGSRRSRSRSPGARRSSRSRSGSPRRRSPSPAKSPRGVPSPNNGKPRSP